MYLYTARPSACLHYKEENIQTIHADVHPSPETDMWKLSLTNGLNTNSDKEYITVRYYIHEEY